MPLNQGQVLNHRYRIVKLLGQGGFGAVYKAWDLTFEIPCALKENSKALPDGQRQFLVEARILRTLRHPNLPQVSDFFVLSNAEGGSGDAYLVMDYVEGEDLEAKLRNQGRALEETQVVAWASQVCDALTYLHSQTPPVIHRDIKPANIKITPEGRAMLVDFGIAKMYDPDSSTTVGARAVTPGFSPIEQYGLGGRTDARTDVYALGATLYTLLTGRPPLEAPQRGPAYPLPAPRSLNPHIRPSVEAAILKAMQYFPEDRFERVEDFKKALLGQPDPPRSIPDRMTNLNVSPAVPVKNAPAEAPPKSKPPVIDPASLPQEPPKPKVTPKQQPGLMGAARMPEVPADDLPLYVDEEEFDRAIKIVVWIFIFLGLMGFIQWLSNFLQ